MELTLENTREIPTEEELVRRARGGDREAFDELIREHYPRVYQLLFRLVGNHEDAEDLAQDSFVKAFAALRWFRGESGFATWVYRIALHRARDHQRSVGRRPRSQALGEELGRELGRTAGGPLQESARRELSSALERAIARLPERLKVALVLRVLEGLEYPEVARITGVTPGTARVHVMKARRQLLRLLGPWIGGTSR